MSKSPQAPRQKIITENAIKSENSARLIGFIFLVL
jgi:hypothetical protein